MVAVGHVTSLPRYGFDHGAQGTQGLVDFDGLKTNSSDGRCKESEGGVSSKSDPS